MLQELYCFNYFEVFILQMLFCCFVSVSPTFFVLTSHTLDYLQLLYAAKMHIAVFEFLRTTISLPFHWKREKSGILSFSGILFFVYVLFQRSLLIQYLSNHWNRKKIAITFQKIFFYCFSYYYHYYYAYASCWT